MGYRYVFSTMFISIGLFFSGCMDDNNPKDVSIYFVEALSEADLYSAKRLSNEVIKKKIDHLYNVCSDYEISIVTNSTMEIFNVFKKDRKFSITINKELRGILSQNFKNNLNKKYGSVSKMTHPQKVAEIASVLEPVAEKIFEKYFIPDVDYGISILDIDDLIEKVFMKVYWQMVIYHLKGEQLYKLVQSLSSMYIINSAFDTPIECINRYTLFDKSINDIGVLNIQKKKYGSLYTGGFKEETVVNLEVVKQDKKVVKMPISVEQIRQDWRVTKSDFVVMDNRTKKDRY